MTEENTQTASRRSRPKFTRLNVWAVPWSVKTRFRAAVSSRGGTVEGVLIHFMHAYAVAVEEADGEAEHT